MMQTGIPQMGQDNTVLIPNHLNYTSAFPVKIAHKYLQIRATPTVLPDSIKGYNNRIQIPLKNDKFLDPYSSYFKMTIDVSNNGALLSTTNTSAPNDGTQIINKVLQLERAFEVSNRWPNFSSFLTWSFVINGGVFFPISFSK